MSAQGVTFDTGMLIALERRKQRAWLVYRRIVERMAPITIPTPVMGEWWRGRNDIRDALAASARIEPLSDALARSAGEALAKVPSATVIEAFVMASAASRGDVVYTGDVTDFEALRGHFPGVRVFGV